jgi:hypothetical protein
MSVYTYYFLNPDGSVPGFEFDSCRSDAEAVARAVERLRRQPGRAAVEVRRGEEVILAPTQESTFQGTAA